MMVRPAMSTVKCMLSNDLVKYLCMYSDLRTYWEDLLFVKAFTVW
jgi:hypothetical protein